MTDPAPDSRDLYRISRDYESTSAAVLLAAASITGAIEKLTRAIEKSDTDR
jgi:hypothetical protein